MIIIGSCVGDEGARFRDGTARTLAGLLEPDDEVVTASGENGICAAYNSLVARARATDGCELLVLLHDDVEVLDHNFRATLLKAAKRPGVGVMGVIGGRDLRSLKWWEARSTAGAVFESREHIDRGSRDVEVDCVDGLFLALTPAAFRTLTFDEASFPRFHGYDVDICLQAKSAGLTNRVVPVDLFHRTKGGYGDKDAFEAAATALQAKWPGYVVPDAPPEDAQEGATAAAEASAGSASDTKPAPRAPTRRRPLARRAVGRARRVARAVGRRARRLLSSSDRAAPVTTVGATAARTRAAAPPSPKVPGPPVAPPPPGPPVAAEEAAVEQASETRETHEAAPVPDQLTCAACATEFRPGLDSPPESHVVLCPGCGLGITWPPPTTDVESDHLWVSMYGGARLKARDTWRREAQLRVDWLKLFVPEGLLLEIGGGTGEFVATARDNGFDARGVEPSVWAAERAREIGADVMAGFLSDWSDENPGVRPDAVAMWHVLEHVHDPGALLAEIRTVLRPGGRLVIEVPNYESTDAQLRGSEWAGLQPTEHVHQFSEGNLRLLVERVGFTVDHGVAFTPAIYLPRTSWNAAKNAAVRDRRPWPPLDYLRLVATAP